jgi:ribosomal protein S18 acetylase RimI-like enzyme
LSTRIVPATVRDILALNRLFTEAVNLHFTYFPEGYRAHVIRDHRPHKLLAATLHPRRIVLVARHDDQIVGYAIGATPNDGRGQLYWLYVDPDRRGENTGLALLSRMLKLQQSKGAHEVSLATHDHRRYYERQGFRFVDNQEIEGVPMDLMTFRFGRAQQ